jgi:photosystem II stability/assembly factor-like uncharacterized protein
LRFRLGGFLLAVFLFSLPSLHAQWKPIGPEGGDARALAYNPQNPDHILLGTGAGQLFVTENGGRSWARLAHLGSGDDYIVDNIAFDPADPKTIYAAAWSVNHEGGDLFRSRDGGRSWQVLPGVTGKSIRALALAESDPKIVTVGALDGVFRSFDRGDTWQRISPTGHADLKNFESLAVDPTDPKVIYAGTWHLPWKTSDGGQTWHSIKQGVLDDSDVFSIIIDHGNPATIYASACSGIYKSENAGAQFHKIQGMPHSARRTRVLQQDSVNASVVYAGTTEGLWKTSDGGKTFHRVTPANYIVNDVLVDPRNASRVLIATDRGGVFASNNGGESFTDSNAGFTHRQVAAIELDHHDANVIYVGVLNDREFGGVFRGTEDGAHWKQMNEGLANLNVFHLAQAPDGTLLAATSRGLFRRTARQASWEPANTVVHEQPAALVPKRMVKGKRLTPAKKPPVKKTEIQARITGLELNGKRWWLATAGGLYASGDAGHAWVPIPEAERRDLSAVSQLGTMVVAAETSGRYLLISGDGGERWQTKPLPDYVTAVSAVAVGPEGKIALATREGALVSRDAGDTWEHLFVGIPSRNMLNIVYYADANILMVTALGSEKVFESSDFGATWTASAPAGSPILRVLRFDGRLLGATAFDGVLLQNSREVSLAPASNVTAR